MPGNQTIELYCLCWNEERMLPFFFRHYDPLVDRYFIFDNGSTDETLSLLRNHGRVELAHFDVLGDSFVEEERSLCNTIWKQSTADWVIVTDIDEHLYHPQFVDYLLQCSLDGVTAIESVGFEMVANSFPTGEGPLTDIVTTGMRSIGHNRLCIFNPQAITETNYNAGRHRASPKGKVVFPDSYQVLLLHYKQLGTDYAVARSAELRMGLRAGDFAQRWGYQYTWSPDEITANWRVVSDGARPVPGLGELRGLDPEAYFLDDNIVHRSGIFDPDWYLETYQDVRSAGAAPFAHYCAFGWKEGRHPNFYFHPSWYRETYPELSRNDRNPLSDYLEIGEKEDARPCPYFDTKWYRDQQGLSQVESPLGHYLARRKRGSVSPNPDFDVIKCLQSYPELFASGKDPFEEHCRLLGK